MLRTHPLHSSRSSTQRANPTHTPSTMKAVFVAATLAAGAQAFAPGAFTGKALATGVKASSSALQMASLDKLTAGKVAPITSGFDPAGLAAKASDAELLRHQESEIKHGRIAMLAVAGMAVAERFHLFFPVSEETTAAIYHPKAILEEYPWFWPVVLIATSAHELDNIKHTFKPSTSTVRPYTELKDGRVPGSLGFDPLSLKPASDAEYQKLRNNEISNGRLAMIAVFGAVAQELVTGKAVF